jgi:hypothetical protein
MNDSTINLTGARPAAKDAETGLRASTALAVVTAGLALGISADTLFRDGIGGVGFAAWIGLLAATLVALAWEDGRALPRETTLWLCSAVAFASWLAWRNSGVLQFFDVVATLGCLGLAVVRMRDPRAGILAERMRETVVAGIRAGLEAAFGLLPLTLHEMATPSSRSGLSTRLRVAVRLTALAVVVLLVFGSLLRSADPIFASIASVPAIDVGNIVSHVLVIVIVGAIAAGWARSALLPRPTRSELPAGYGFSLGTAEVTTILGTLNALFALFVVAQLGWFFGGEQFLRERTGLTVAQYARGGFFQMLWVVALVVPVLVVTRGALQPGRVLARRHTMLAVPIVALLGTMIACSMARLNLYVKFYGMTTDRLYPLVFMSWLFATLLWLSVTVLRDWGRPFAAGAVVAAMATLMGLNALDPDAFVARINVARAQRPLRPDAGRLDVRYLAQLSGGAVPYAVNALIADDRTADRSSGDAAGHRCIAANLLIGRFGPARQHLGGGSVDVDARWRFWNADDAVAASAVSRHFRELLAIRHSACATARAASNVGSTSRNP